MTTEPTVTPTAEPPASLLTFPSVDAVGEALIGQRYVSDTSLAMAIFLSCGLPRPLLVEGEAGVGKTEIAKVLAAALNTRLIRLQCYEGIDVRQAVYEWNYSKQMLRIRSLEQSAGSGEEAFDSIFGPEYLIRRPLLQAIEAAATERPPVLLIDEIDRADDEFEAFLLEVLSTNQVTIPEYGVVRADKPPVVVLTSNRTRELHDALKRRCLYHWIDHPGLAREVEIVRSRLPEVSAKLAEQVARAVQRMRASGDLLKPPGVSETLDWARALHQLGRDELDLETASATLGAVLKYREDSDRVRKTLDLILAG
jgi:MoxR-like ATPase